MTILGIDLEAVLATILNPLLRVPRVTFQVNVTQALIDQYGKAAFGRAFAAAAGTSDYCFFENRANWTKNGMTYEVQLPANALAHYNTPRGQPLSPVSFQVNDPG